MSEILKKIDRSFWWTLIHPFYFTIPLTRTIFRDHVLIKISLMLYKLVVVNFKQVFFIWSEIAHFSCLGDLFLMFLTIKISIRFLFSLASFWSGIFPPFPERLLKAKSYTVFWSKPDIYFYVAKKSGINN